MDERTRQISVSCVVLHWDMPADYCERTHRAKALYNAIGGKRMTPALFAPIEIDVEWVYNAVVSNSIFMCTMVPGDELPYVKAVFRLRANLFNTIIRLLCLGIRADALWHSAGFQTAREVYESGMFDLNCAILGEPSPFVSMFDTSQKRVHKQG
jgi:hypothetical protein